MVTLLYAGYGKRSKRCDEKMGLIINLLTSLLYGKEMGDLVTSFSYINARDQMRHDEILEEMRREHQERMAMESQRR